MAARWCLVLIAAACAHDPAPATPATPTSAPVDPALQTEIPTPPPLPAVPEPDPDPTRVPPPAPAASTGQIVTRVLATEVRDGEQVVIIALSPSFGVTIDWKAEVLEADTDRPLPGGEIQLVRVTRRELLGKVHLTVDQLGHNQRVRMTPP